MKRKTSIGSILLNLIGVAVAGFIVFQIVGLGFLGLASMHLQDEEDASWDLMVTGDRDLSALKVFLSRALDNEELLNRLETEHLILNQAIWTGDLKGGLQASEELSRILSEIRYALPQNSLSLPQSILMDDTVSLFRQIEGKKELVKNQRAAFNRMRSFFAPAGRAFPHKNEIKE